MADFNDEPEGEYEIMQEREAVQLDRQIETYGQWLAGECDKAKARALAGPTVARYAHMHCERINTLAHMMNSLGQVADQLRMPRRIRIEQAQYRERNP